MRLSRIPFTALIAFLPMAALGALEGSDLPDEATWYIHVDLAEMRSTEAGKSLYGWLDDEVFADIKDETGVDLGQEADRLTAFSLGKEGFVMMVDGKFSQATRDKAMAAAATAERFDTLKSGGKVYYRVQGDDDSGFELDNGNIELGGVDDEIYFSFDVRNKLLVSSSETELKALLANGGKVAGQKSHKGALFVISAESSLIQAGLNTDGFNDDDDDGFKSNVMRNTRQVAVMVADIAGKVAIEVQLLASEAAAAESLASIVRGLIALQVFSDDMDPEIANFLNNTRVEVDNTLLKISVALSPESLSAVLDDV